MRKLVVRWHTRRYRHARRLVERTDDSRQAIVNRLRWPSGGWADRLPAGVRKELIRDV